MDVSAEAAVLVFSVFVAYASLYIEDAERSLLFDKRSDRYDAAFALIIETTVVYAFVNAFVCALGWVNHALVVCIATQLFCVTLAFWFGMLDRKTVVCRALLVGVFFDALFDHDVTYRYAMALIETPVLFSALRKAVESEAFIWRNELRIRVLSRTLSYLEAAAEVAFLALPLYSVLSSTASAWRIGGYLVIDRILNRKGVA